MTHTAHVAIRAHLDQRWASLTADWHATKRLVQALETIEDGLFRRTLRDPLADFLSS